MKVKRRERSNTFCGPAVLSLITGKHVDECVQEIHAYRNRGKFRFVPELPLRRVKGMTNPEIVAVLFRLGYQTIPIDSALGCWNGFVQHYKVGTLKKNRTLVAFMRWLKQQDEWSPKKVYLINVTGHYVVMKGIKLFDNRNPEGVFFGKYNHRRVRVKDAWDVARPSGQVPVESCR